MNTILSDLLPDVNSYERMNECELRDEIARLRRAIRRVPQDVVSARIQLCQQRLDEIGLIGERRAVRANPVRFREVDRLLSERQRCIDATIAAIEVMEMAL